MHVRCIRPSLVHYLFPVYLCSKNRDGQGMIIDYLLYQCTNARFVYIVFQIHFTITVTARIRFLPKITSAHDFELSNVALKIDVGSDKK